MLLGQEEGCGDMKAVELPRRREEGERRGEEMR